MYIVTNRIKTKPGFAEKMAPNFTRPGELQKMKGFIKVEVTITQNLPEEADYDEMNVNMYWEDMESFQGWRNSDVFKESHNRPEPDSADAEKESPLLGSQIVITKIASVIEAVK